MPILGPSDGLVDVPAEAGDTSSTQRLDVKELGDLPAPVTGVITTLDNVTVNLLENIDLSGNRLVLGAGASLNGVSDLSTTLSGSTAVDVPLVSNAGNTEISRLTMTQLGEGDLFLQDVAGSVIEMFDVNRNGRYIGRQGQLLQTSFGNATSALNSVISIDGQLDFIILSDADLLWPQKIGARTIEFKSTAIVQRCTLDTATPLLRDLTVGFGEVFGSVGIYVEKGAQIEIFTQLNAGFRPLSNSSQHLVMEDPADISFGLLEGNTFSNIGTTGTLYGCEPIVSTSPEVVGREFTGLTYDGKDAYALDPVALQLIRFEGVTNVEDGTFFTAASMKDVAYYKGDFFMVTSTVLFLHQGFTTFEDNWSLAQIFDTTGGQAFDTFNAIATDGVNIYILGQRDITLVYTLFIYPPELATNLVTEAPNAIEEIDVSSIITQGEVYLDYDGVNLVIASSENIVPLPLDPLTNTNWDLTGSTARVNQFGGSVSLQNLEEASSLNFADFTILTTPNSRYDVHITVTISLTEMQIEVLDEDDVQIAIVTSSGSGVLDVSFIATSLTSTLRWKNIETTLNDVSVIDDLTQERGAITLLKGTTNEVQYSFAMANPTLNAARFASGIAVLTESPDLAQPVSAGFLTASQPATVANSLFQVYDTSLTLDHSAPNWEMMNNIGDTVIESSARGGSSFTGSVTFTPIEDIYQDIANANIIYTAFTAREKCFLFDSTSGMMKWTGVREKAQLLTGAITLSTSFNGAISSIAIVINGMLQDDSVATIAWDNQRPTQTLTTLPISRDLTVGDEIVVQGTETGGNVGTTTWDVLAVRLSIA